MILIKKVCIDKMVLVEKINQSIENDYSQYNKLSRLKSRPNAVNGNSDDLVNIDYFLV